LEEDRVKELLEIVREMRRTGDCKALTDVIPYARFMGITADVSSGELVGKLTYSDMLIGNTTLPALHGGTLSALLESTAIFEVIWQAETIVLPKTINITIEFVRSGKPLDTYANAIISRRGRRVTNVRAEAWQEDRDRPIAIAYMHFLIIPIEE
jgi:acyl-coenzyme A thioesterase PaaI-like protein